MLGDVGGTFLGDVGVCGATFALRPLPQQTRLEIISVDSVMVYKECNVGSAKPPGETLERYPHHLVNHVSLDSIFSVADFHDY